MFKAPINIEFLIESIDKINIKSYYIYAPFMGVY